MGLTLFAVFLPGLAAVAGLLLACAVDERRHHADGDCGFDILPWRPEWED